MCFAFCRHIIFSQRLAARQIVGAAISTLLDPSPQDGTLTPAEICEQTLAAQANIISFDYEFVTPASRTCRVALWLGALSVGAQHTGRNEKHGGFVRTGHHDRPSGYSERGIA